VWLFLGMALLCVGCFSHLYGEPMRGVDLKARQRVYVERHAEDHRDIARMIAGRLRESGFEATSGPPQKAPSGVQAIVSYEGHWVLDGLAYLIVLRIDFRDPKTNELLASGQSYHTSGDRKPPEFMVDEIVTTILAGS
jgi:hypothetical protein